MDTVFPDAPGFDGLFITGFRKKSDAPGETEMVGSAIVKRSYALDVGSGELTPEEEARPVLDVDVPDNLVKNSGFMAPEDDAVTTPEGWPDDWEPDEGVTVTRVADPDDDAWNLRLRGSSSGGMRQVIEGDEPLGGAYFTLSFEVRSDEENRISDVALEADADSGPVSICTVSADTDEDFALVVASGRWPSSLEATSMTLVLRVGDDGGDAVDYRNVQVEARAYRTAYAPATTLRYESDLVAFKPVPDIVVLDHTEAGGLSTVRVDGVTWMSRVVTTGSPAEKSLFGWEPRVSDTRRDEAGAFSDDPDDYPPQWPPPFDRPQLDPLPNGSTGAVFQNVHFNGHRRDAVVALPDHFIPDGAVVEITREGGADVQSVRLGAEGVRATRYDHVAGDDREDAWQATEVTMHLDTLVVEPAQERAYAVWRGVFEFNPDAHRRLVVEAES